METFSDDVIAIIITVRGLELKVPQGADPAALRPLAPVFSELHVKFYQPGQLPQHMAYT
jgi:uncharacterized membrane protein